MNRVKFLHLCLLVAVMRNAACSDNEEPFGPSPPDDTVFKKIPSSTASVKIMRDEIRWISEEKTFEECHQIALSKGAHFFILYDGCIYGTLQSPLCSTPSGSEYELFVDEKYVTDGSPSDGAYMPANKIMQNNPNRGFRVNTPTILEIPGFAEEYDNGPVKKIIMVLHTNDGIFTSDGHYLIDPACHTNSSCGLAIVTTAVELDTLRYVILHDVCGQTIDIGSDPGINVFSHEDIGCKFFPDDYPVSNCEVTISGSGTLKVNATLVNFRETTCDGSELVVDTPSSDGTTNAVDVCTENAPTEFTATAGEVKISFSAGAGQTGQKYGFIISITK